ncbi:MAG: hypothetical protein JWR37_5114 [Mycobacterium sp.]|jgi:hypothetical protein|nr:hypothetical protein [Mycobacterium sp.]
MWTQAGDASANSRALGTEAPISSWMSSANPLAMMLRCNWLANVPPRRPPPRRARWCRSSLLNRCPGRCLHRRSRCGARCGRPPRPANTDDRTSTVDLMFTTLGRRRPGPRSVRHGVGVPGRGTTQSNPNDTASCDASPLPEAQDRLGTCAAMSGAILSARYACPASLGCTPSAPMRSGLPTNQRSASGSTNAAPATQA